MSNEQETKRLLQFRETMEQRMAELEAEAADLKAAMAAIDNMIVAGGFRTPTVSKAAPRPTPQAEAPQPESFEEGMSITSKDGAVLGRMTVEGKDLHTVARFVAEKLAPLENVRGTTTHFLLKKYKEDGVILKHREEDKRIAISY